MQRRFREDKTTSLVNCHAFALPNNRIEFESTPNRVEYIS